MDTFYLIVLGVASLVLICMLAFLGWNMSQAKKGSRYPTITTSCPDNWIPTETTVDNKINITCARPPSGYNMGGSSNGTGANIKYKDKPLTTFLTTAPLGSSGNLNVTDPLWAKDKDPTCEKREWASAYGIKWDSVESANYCE